MNLQDLVVSISLRIFKLLLRLLPTGFRGEYGDELLLVFRDLLTEAEERGWIRTASVALGSLWDVLRTGVCEHWQAFRDRHNFGTHKCTPRAQAALSFADQEALRLDRHTCGDEHILLGLLHEGGGVAAIALQKLGIELHQVRNEIDRCYSARTEAPAATDRTSEVLASARANAVGLGHRFVGTEHVLLGILTNPQRSLEIVLENVGLSCDQVRRETLALLNHTPTREPTNVRPGISRATPAMKAMFLAGTLLLLFAFIRLLLVASGQPVSQNSAPQSEGLSSEQNEKAPLNSQKATEQPKYRIEEVQIPLKATQPLKGTIVIPNAAHRVPAILVIPGYGRSDGEVSPPASSQEEAGIALGRYLAEYGIAVARVPFGTGPTGNEPDLSVSELADRALECVSYLKGRSDIDPKRVGVFGHSAGGGVAILAASRSSDVAFLVAAATPLEPIESTVFAIIDGVLTAGGAKEADRTAVRILQQKIFVSLAGGATAEELRPDVQELFRSLYARFPKDHPALLGKNPEDEIKHAAERQLKTLTSPWFRGLLGFDPAAALAKSHCPALVLFAEKDQKIEPRKNREIAKTALDKSGQRGSDVEVIPKADHSFEAPSADPPSADQQSRQRFSAEFLVALSSWLVDRIDSERPAKSQSDKP